LIKRTKKLKPSGYIPFSKEPLGYGNLVDDIEFKKILKKKKILKILNEKFNSKFVINHLVFANKAPWIGPSAEWHQEIFNINTYAPGCSKKKWKSFLQIYIALEDQNIENGCLRLFKDSHKLGELPHIDIVNEFFNHKRSVKFEDLQKLNAKNKLVHCNMKAGDVLFFNHLLVHGSSSNASNRSRKSIVIQARSSEIKKNDKIFRKETAYRQNFAKNKLKEKIFSLEKKQLYQSFNK
jgi:ectoine hydroxylase-related dioxygenase (phytanoyl-CoA dioxygenase family)